MKGYSVMSRTVPSFLVVGAGRAGTTGLVQGLRSHPQVFVTTPKEPHYFALHGTRPDFRGPGDEESINGVAITRERDYLALYPRSGLRQTAFGEGSVSTLYYHDRALPEVMRINPEMRVVVLLREPVARAYSSFQYLRAQGREPEEDFLVALERESQRRAENWHHLWHYSAMSMYAEALGAFREHLLPGHLGIWFHDDLERDYAATFTDVLRFLDLPPVPGVGQDVPRVNISGTPRHQRLQHGIWWATDRPALRRTARAVTSWQFREALRSRLLRRDGVPEHVVQALAPAFKDDLARLRDLLGTSVEMPAWLRSSNGLSAA
jgi:hypothetical protein